MTLCFRDAAPLAPRGGTGDYPDELGARVEVLRARGRRCSGASGLRGARCRSMAGRVPGTKARWGIGEYSEAP